jgi:hypothetical protein
MNLQQNDRIQNEAHYFTLLIVYRFYTPGCLEWVRFHAVYLGRGKGARKIHGELNVFLNLHSSGRYHGLTGTSLTGCWCRTTAVVLGGRTSKPTRRWL